MTIPSYKSNAPVYIIAIRDEDAKEKLTKWLAANRNASAKVEEHRLQIYDQNTLNLFTVTWTHNLNNVTIWDCWNRRHIYIN
mgnify:CR=1 FL=1|jgi:hypothetical protein|tara:strand:+ start:293 stop:538 length:246 start_codon:yes stop_codon:yes gene_type:complete